MCLAKKRKEKIDNVSDDFHRTDTGNSLFSARATLDTTPHRPVARRNRAGPLALARHARSRDAHRQSACPDADDAT